MQKGNFYFFTKKSSFSRAWNGQRSVMEPGPTPSPWSIICKFLLFPELQTSKWFLESINMDNLLVIHQISSKACLPSTVFTFGRREAISLKLNIVLGLSVGKSGCNGKLAALGKADGK